MKHVLISCDACGKTVPDKSVRGWWGLVDPKSDLPTFSFAPLTPKMIDKFSGHVCGAECLQKSLEALAAAVDMKKAAVAGNQPPAVLPWSFPSFFDVSGASSADDITDSVSYYKPKKKEKAADDDEEEY